MNNREEIFKKEKKLGITQQEADEDMVIEWLTKKTDQKMDGLLRWLQVQQMSLPTIEY